MIDYLAEPCGHHGRAGYDTFCEVIRANAGPPRIRLMNYLPAAFHDSNITMGRET
jgi:hypothetical protein